MPTKVNYFFAAALISASMAQTRANDWELGTCSDRFVRMIKPKNQGRAQQLRELSRQVQSTLNLKITEAKRIGIISTWREDGLGKMVEKPLGIDTTLESEAAYSTAIGLARRAERIRDSLTIQEWSALVVLWSRYLSAAAVLIGSENQQDLCGLGEHLVSLPYDPFMAQVECVRASFKPHDALEGLACSPAVQVLGLIEGPLRLAADGLTLIPSGLAKLSGFDHRLKNSRSKRTTRLLQTFGNTICKYERNEEMRNE